MNNILIINSFCTFALFGLIWTIQLVHYPSFRFVDETKFVEFEKFHSQKITYIVLPLMIVELITSAYLVYLNPLHAVLHFNLLCVLIVWTTTFLFSVPCHNQLMNGKDQKVINSLVKTNWPRTVFWTFKTLILLSLILNYKNA